MKLRDLERHLTAHGARKVGEGGKHTKWRSAEGALQTVRLHPHVKSLPAIVKGIRKKGVGLVLVDGSPRT